MRELVILVPKHGSRPEMVIDKASGVVADESATFDPPDHVMVYFEGNRYGASNMNRYEEKLLHAAGRLSSKYPTVARAVFRWDEFDIVGRFMFSPDWRVHRVEITDSEAVSRWLA